MDHGAISPSLMVLFMFKQGSPKTRVSRFMSYMSFMLSYTLITGLYISLLTNYQNTALLTHVERQISLLALTLWSLITASFVQLLIASFITH